MIIKRTPGKWVVFDEKDGIEVTLSFTHKPTKKEIAANLAAIDISPPESDIPEPDNDKSTVIQKIQFDKDALLEPFFVQEIQNNPQITFDEMYQAIMKKWNEPVALLFKRLVYDYVDAGVQAGIFPAPVAQDVVSYFQVLRDFVANTPVEQVQALLAEV